MKWLSETPPHWVWPRDTWERLQDAKVFKADISAGHWISEDKEGIEIIVFHKDCIVDEV